MQHPELEGPFNFSAPHLERRAAVARIPGRLLHRPALVPAPALAMRLILGLSR